MSITQAEEQYAKILRNILTKGFYRPDRTGTGTFSQFNVSIHADLSNNLLPVLTGKKVAHRLAISEMLWMLNGGRNIKQLWEDNNHIWDEWADDEGDLGPVYGAQWRYWTGMDDNGFETRVDQIDELVNGIKKTPFGRRHIVTAWNPSQLRDMALPPCPTMFQVLVDSGMGLHVAVTQRSGDMFLGVPFDMVGYATLTHLLAKHLGGSFKAQSLAMNIGDAHLYRNHVDQAEQYLQQPILGGPRLFIHNKHEALSDYVLNDFKVLNYVSGPAINAPVAV